MENDEELALLPGPIVIPERRARRVSRDLAHLMIWGCLTLCHSVWGDATGVTRSVNVSVVIPARVEAGLRPSPPSATASERSVAFCVSGSQGSLYSIRAAPGWRSLESSTEVLETLTLKSTSEPGLSCDPGSETLAWQRVPAVGHPLTLIVAAE